MRFTRLRERKQGQAALEEKEGQIEGLITARTEQPGQSYKKMGTLYEQIEGKISKKMKSRQQ